MNKPICQSNYRIWSHERASGVCKGYAGCGKWLDFFARNIIYLLKLIKLLTNGPRMHYCLECQIFLKFHHINTIQLMCGGIERAILNLDETFWYLLLYLRCDGIIGIQTIIDQIDAGITLTKGCLLLAFSDHFSWGKTEVMIRFLLENHASSCGRLRGDEGCLSKSSGRIRAYSNCDHSRRVEMESCRRGREEGWGLLF